MNRGATFPRQWLLDALEDADRPLTSQELAESCNVDATTIRRHCRDLAEKNVVQKTWIITSDRPKWAWELEGNNGD